MRASCLSSGPSLLPKTPLARLGGGSTRGVLVAGCSGVPIAASSSTRARTRAKFGDRGASAEIGEVVATGEFRVTSAGLRRRAIGEADRGGRLRALVRAWRGQAARAGDARLQRAASPGCPAASYARARSTRSPRPVLRPDPVVEQPTLTSRVGGGPAGARGGPQGIALAPAGGPAAARHLTVEAAAELWLREREAAPAS